MYLDIPCLFSFILQPKTALTLMVLIYEPHSSVFLHFPPITGTWCQNYFSGRHGGSRRCFRLISVLSRRRTGGRYGSCWSNFESAFPKPTQRPHRPWERAVPLKASVWRLQARTDLASRVAPSSSGTLGSRKPSSLAGPALPRDVPRPVPQLTPLVLSEAAGEAPSRERAPPSPRSGLWERAPGGPGGGRSRAGGAPGTGRGAAGPAR